MNNIEALITVLTHQTRSKKARLKIARHVVENQLSRIVFDEVAPTIDVAATVQKNMFEELQDLHLGFLERATSKKSHSDTKIASFSWKDPTSSLGFLAEALAQCEKTKDPAPTIVVGSASVEIDWKEFQNNFLSLSDEAKRTIISMTDEKGTTVLAETMEKELKTLRLVTVEAFELCDLTNLGEIRQGMHKKRVLKYQFEWRDIDTKLKVGTLLRKKEDTRNLSSIFPEHMHYRSEKPTVIREEILVNGKTVIFLADAEIDMDEFDIVSRLMERKLPQFIKA